jgi:anti-sigma factor RsiW
MQQGLDCRLVTPEQLLAYATGQADNNTARHVEVCAACSAQVTAYARTDHVLRKNLFRVDCPAVQTLGDLALELLSPQEVLSVRGHLALCPHCRRELATLEVALQEVQ